MSNWTRRRLLATAWIAAQFSIMMIALFSHYTAVRLVALGCYVAGIFVTKHLTKWVRSEYDSHPAN